MNEVISMLEDDSKFASANIYIQPPDNSNDTDEDSGSEDNGGSLDNLTGRQLRAEAEATIFSLDHQKTVIGDTDTDVSDSETVEEERSSKITFDQQSSAGIVLDNVTDFVMTDETNQCRSVKPRLGKRQRSESMSTNSAKLKENTSSMPAPQTSRKGSPHAGDTETGRPHMPNVKPKKKTGSVPQTRVWTKKDIKRDDSRSPKLSKPAFLSRDMTPTCLFEYFFDDEIVKFIVDMSLIYAHQKLKPNLEITSDDFRAFLAILLLSGYVPLPRRRMYWEQSSDVQNEAVTGAMSLNRFEEILRYLHLADNTQLDPTDKMAKVRPLFDHLNKKYAEYWPAEEDLDVDESMVPYYGHHSSKQFIRGKPIRFGFKLWCLNARLGYLVQFDPYQGASASYDSTLGRLSLIIANSLIIIK